MMRKRYLLLAVISVIALVQFACATGDPSAQETEIAASIFATQTAEAPTETPLPTNTPVPPPTEIDATATLYPTEPAPDPWLRFEDAVLLSSDLPPGYMPMGEDQLQEMLADLEMDQFETISRYGFMTLVSANDVAMVAGANLYVEEGQSQLIFDVSVAQIADFLGGFIAQGVGSESVSEEILDIGDVGDLNGGVVLQLDVQGLPMEMQIVLFRRGEVGVLLMIVTTGTHDFDLDIGTIAGIIDQRILDVYASE